MREVSHRLDYKLSKLQIIPPPPDLSDDLVDKKLAASPLKGKKVTVRTAPGLYATQAERRALTWHLANWAKTLGAGAEYRVLYPISPNEKDQWGQVILRYDVDMNATAVLAGRGEALGGAPAPARDPALMMKELEHEYAFAGVRGTWDVLDLVKVSRALALLSKDERATLSGVYLERVKVVPSSGSPEGKPRSEASYHHDAGPAIGTLGVIYVADAAFTDDGTGFYGGDDGEPAKPPSFQSILHEVGHVITSAARRDHARENAKAAVASLGDKRDYRPHEPIPQQDVIKAQLLAVQHVDAELELGSLADRAYHAVAAGDADAADLVAQCRTKAGVLTKLADLLDAMRTGAAPSAAKELATRLHTECLEVARLLESAFLLRRDLTKAKPQDVLRELDAIQGKVKALNHEPWTAFCTELGRWSEVQRRVAEWAAVYQTGTGYTTERRANFVACVKENRIPVDLTAYAGASWPDKPDELLCEAFSIWKLDPLALQRHSKELYDYFVKKRHLNGR